VIVRIIIWSLYDSKTTIEELRDSLAELEPPSTWLWNGASERFGVVAFGGNLPEEVARAARELIGTDPQLADEFDILER